MHPTISRAALAAVLATVLATAACTAAPSDRGAPSPVTVVFTPAPLAEGTRTFGGQDGSMLAQFAAQQTPAAPHWANRPYAENLGVLGETAACLGAGVQGNATAASGVNRGLQGQTWSTEGLGVYGTAIATTGRSVGVQGQSASSSGYGVFAKTISKTGTTYGLWAEAQSDAGVGVHARTYGELPGAAALVCERVGAANPGNIAVFYGGGGVRATIDSSGRGTFAAGVATASSGYCVEVAASVAASVAARVPEAGDVIAIDPEFEGRFAVCGRAESPLVAGICAAAPGVTVAGPASRIDDCRGALVRTVSLAVAGAVPCNVCDEAGPIRPGDLLVSASRAGHAKKAPAAPAAGTILGKALGTLDTGAGRMAILVTLR